MSHSPRCGREIHTKKRNFGSLNTKFRNFSSTYKIPRTVAYMRQPILNGAFFIPKSIFQPYSASVFNKVKVARLSTLQLNRQGYYFDSPLLKRRALSSCTPRNAPLSPHNQHQHSRAAMATDSVPTVAGLSIHSTTSEVSKYPNCYPAVNPVDTYRAHIAELVGEALGIDSQSVYPKIQWTNSLDKGDLVLAV